MIIDNAMINMDAYLLIEILLWVSKPSKQVQVLLNNHTYRATTQHLKFNCTHNKRVYTISSQCNTTNVTQEYELNILFKLGVIT